MGWLPCLYPLLCLSSGPGNAEQALIALSCSEWRNQWRPGKHGTSRFSCLLYSCFFALHSACLSHCSLTQLQHKLQLRFSIALWCSLYLTPKRRPIVFCGKSSLFLLLWEILIIFSSLFLGCFTPKGNLSCTDCIKSWWSKLTQKKAVLTERPRAGVAGSKTCVRASEDKPEEEHPTLCEPRHPSNPELPHRPTEAKQGLWGLFTKP